MVDGIKTVIFGILLCLVAFCSSEQEAKELTEIELETKSLEKGFLAADKCTCKNGFCEKNSKGKLVCKCRPEWGLSSDGNECTRCDCGEGANCTFTRGILGDSKTCICKKGSVVLNSGTCKNCNCGKDFDCKFSVFGTKTCLCDKGYKEKGGVCVDECTGVNCQNGGKCYIKDGKAICNCTERYTGNTCQTDQCNCKNGFCEKNAEGNLVCKCPPEWGFHPYNQECTKCDCGEGANCTIFPSVFGSGYTSKTCICKKGSVLDSGTCKNTSKIDLDECKAGTHSCPKNTVCLKVPGDYICQCKPGYWKENNNDKEDCQEKCNCENGFCEKNFSGKLVCKCPPEWGLSTSGNKCIRCDCGEGSNCTFSDFLEAKFCVCKTGTFHENGVCRPINTGDTTAFFNQTSRNIFDASTTYHPLSTSKEFQSTPERKPERTTIAPSTEFERTSAPTATESSTENTRVTTTSPTLKLIKSLVVKILIYDEKIQ